MGQPCADGSRISQQHMIGGRTTTDDVEPIPYWPYNQFEVNKTKHKYGRTFEPGYVDVLDDPSPRHSRPLEDDRGMTLSWDPVSTLAPLRVLTQHPGCWLLHTTACCDDVRHSRRRSGCCLRIYHLLMVCAQQDLSHSMDRSAQWWPCWWLSIIWDWNPSGCRSSWT